MKSSCRDSVGHRSGRVEWLRWLESFARGRRDASARQRLKAFWAGLAAERTRVERPGLFAYNVFAVSRKDLARLEALQREYLSQMRTIIAASEPSEVVALSNLQLFALED